jgi:hypothetical protein
MGGELEGAPLATPTRAGLEVNPGAREGTEAAPEAQHREAR